MFPRRRFPIFRRGVFRYQILQLLNEKPMHGYDIIKSLHEESGGVYRPSAGAIYPTLQSLEEEGYVTSEEKEGKKTYTITDSGKEYLKKAEERIKTVVENRKAFLTERKELNHEMHNLSSLIFTNYRDLKKEKADAVAQVLKETRRKISDIIFE